MIKSRKLVTIAALCAFTTGISFAQEVSFENKLTTRIVDIIVTDDDSESDFAGFENETTAEYSSDKLDMGLTLKFNLAKEDADDAISIGSDEYVDDFFIEYRPVDLLGIGFHKGYSVAGSYLPCLDADIDAANIGSDFGVFIRPLEGFVISGGLDFISYFGRDDEDPLVNFGAEYAFNDKLTFGAAFRNVITEDRTIGAYASFTGFEGLTLNAGYTYNGEIEDFNISGNLINAAVMFNKNALGILADAVFAAGGEEDFDNELYTEIMVSYQISEALSASLYGSFSTDFDNDDSWCVGIKPTVGYMFNEHNSLLAGVFVNIMKPAKSISFPIKWIYTF